MSGCIWLLVHTLKRLSTLLAAMGLLLAGFQMILILVARSIAESGGFAQLADMLPPFVRDIMGPAMAGMMSFAGIVCVGYFDVPVIASLVGLAIAVGTTPASEVETGFMDLILSRPLARHWVITRTIAAAALSTAALLALMAAGTWAGLEWLAPEGAGWPSRSLIGSLVVNLWLLLLCWSGIAAAIGSVSRRRAVAGTTAGLLALAAFLLDYVGRLWKAAEPVARISPFRYYNALDLVRGEPLPAKSVIVLCAIAAASYAIAYVGFARRDISH